MLTNLTFDNGTEHNLLWQYMFSAFNSSIKNEENYQFRQSMFILTSQPFCIDITDYIERTISIKQQYFLIRNFTTCLYLKRNNNVYPLPPELETIHSERLP